MAGNVRPRLSNDDTATLMVSMPSPEVQTRVADEVVQRAGETHRRPEEVGSGGLDGSEAVV